MKFISMPILVFLIMPLVHFAYGQTGLKGNVGEVILTPTLETGYTLGGYGARMSRPAEAVHDDIKTKA